MNRGGKKEERYEDSDGAGKMLKTTEMNVECTGELGVDYIAQLHTKGFLRVRHFTARAVLWGMM